MFVKTTIMKAKLYLLLLLASVGIQSCSEQNNDEANLFERIGGKVVAKAEYATRHDPDVERWIDSLGLKVTDYRAFPVSSANNQYKCTVRIEGLQSNVKDDSFEQVSIVDANGTTIYRQYDEMFGKMWLLMCDMSTTPQYDTYFEKVDLDDDSYALFFSKWFYSCCPQDPGDMLIIVVNKNVATMVYEGPAYAISPTDFHSKDFSIEFVKDARGLYNDDDGFVFTPDRLAKHTKYKIFKDGNILKIQSWE